MTEPICPELVTASILEDREDTFGLHLWEQLLVTDFNCFESKYEPGEVVLSKEHEEFPELALVLLHQSITTNLKTQENKR